MLCISLEDQEFLAQLRRDSWLCVTAPIQLEVTDYLEDKVTLIPLFSL